MNKRYERYIEYVVNDLEIPYFINMRDSYGLSPNEYELVLSKLYKQPVSIKGDYVYNNKGNEIYHEDSRGRWYKKEYDAQGNEIYFEDNYGNLAKYEYDANGNIIYFENDNGYWEKKVYDDQGKLIYYEDSRGFWYKKEYNEQGKITYREDSNGYIIDNR